MATTMTKKERLHALTSQAVELTNLITAIRAIPNKVGNKREIVQTYAEGIESILDIRPGLHTVNYANSIKKTKEICFSAIAQFRRKLETEMEEISNDLFIQDPDNFEMLDSYKTECMEHLQKWKSATSAITGEMLDYLATEFNIWGDLHFSERHGRLYMEDNTMASVEWFYDSDVFNNTPREICVQTTSWGSIKPEDILLLNCLKLQVALLTDAKLRQTVEACHKKYVAQQEHFTERGEDIEESYTEIPETVKRIIRKSL